MSIETNVNQSLIESLYCEALVLADEVRAYFDLTNQILPEGADKQLAQAALSCEAMRTTTRMMQAITWLLQQRAHLAGELSEAHLRLYGKLSPDFLPSDPQRTAQLPVEITRLITATEEFYARLLRIDHGYRAAPVQQPAGIDMLRARLGAQIAA